MIIKEILLENFMCYYDENTFELSNGLNIILGHNGDGKTTLFTAFKWIFDPLFNLSTKDIYSLKKFSETSIGDSFETKVGIKVEQYNQIYTIEKAFEITNKSGIAKLSSINNTIFILDLETGESSYCDEDIKVVLNRVFPTDFRNFSMFETEAETLDLVKGKPLYKLVQLFSNARFYENLEQIANKISSKARKAYISESKADEETKRKLDNFDTKILESEVEIKRLDKRISEDDNGLRDIQEVFDEYARNSNLSDEINRVNKTIQDQEEKKQSLQRAVKNKYTDYLFDNSYILVGFPKIHSEFSEKVDKLRQERNRIEEEFLAASVEEEYKLTLANGTTPLPPGSPTETILNEFLRDGICKICNRQLDQNSIDFMNKSLELKNKSLVKGPIKRPKFFHNSFIKDLELHDDKLNNIHDSQNDIHNYESDIDKLVELNVRLEADIKECNILIDSLEKERKDILFRAPSSLSEDKIMALTAHISQ